MSELAALLRARHPGARITVDGDSVHVVLAAGGGWHSARLRAAPMAEIYLGLPVLDGFTMTVEDAATGWPWSHSDLPFDGRYRVTTNDPALAGRWLDDEATRAIVSQRYEATAVPLGLALPGVAPIVRPWRFELAGSELAVLKGAPENDLDRLCDALAAGAMVVASCHRIAAAWRAVADGVGGWCGAARWDVGGEFAITCERRGTAVRIRHARRRSNEPSHEFRLRTVVEAPRVTPHDDALVVWRRGALAQPRRAARKLAPLALPGLGGHGARASQLSRGAARLDAGVRNLIALSGLDALELDARTVAVWFDGMIDEVPRLEAAIELCAQLAVDAVAADGPYR